MSSSVTSSGSFPSRAASSSPRFSRSSGGMYAIPSRSYTSSSVVNASDSPVASSEMPYSLT